ncbi:MAG: methyltransferase domain-containing protein [Proteobacteria bacterium]|nr:methyltransferase domain-containing protein [Pseudomonadota bacterium]
MTRPTSATSVTSSSLIDSACHRQRRDRAAADFAKYDFIKQATASRIADRLGLMRRRFPRVLDLGCHRGEVAQAIATTNKTDQIITADPSFNMAWRAKNAGYKPGHAERQAGRTDKQTRASLVVDYDRLCFAPNSFDALVSGFALHWVGDLPRLFATARQLLKADGLLLLCLAGGTSFAALRACLATAETEIAGGLSPRVLPMADMRSLADLLARAGFALPVADSETVTITWDDAFAMMRDLRGMGESNALAGRVRHFTRVGVLRRAAEIYQQRFSKGGKVEAEIELITLTGWVPDATQQQPLAPGSGAVDLADALAGSGGGGGE